MEMNCEFSSLETETWNTIAWAVCIGKNIILGILEAGSSLARWRFGLGFQDDVLRTMFTVGRTRWPQKAEGGQTNLVKLLLWECEFDWQGKELLWHYHFLRVLPLDIITWAMNFETIISLSPCGLSHLIPSQTYWKTSSCFLQITNCPITREHGWFSMHSVDHELALMLTEHPVR